MQRVSMCGDIIDSLSAHIAILDKDGMIILTNRAWQEFGAANSLEGPTDSLGQNYLTISEQAEDKTGHIIAQAIRKVIAGELQEFFTNYPCHSKTLQRWFAMRVVRLQSAANDLQVVVSHEDITPIMQAQLRLKKKEKELSRQKKMLEESNVALKVLLEHRERDRRRLEDNVLANVRKLVIPYVEDLQNRKLDARSKNLVDIIQQRLAEVVSPFLNRLTSLNRLLTPREIDVAALIRDGRTSKEIAEMLTISVSGVDFHRKRIRSKLGLTHEKSNLRSYLLSLQ